MVSKKSVELLLSGRKIVDDYNKSRMSLVDRNKTAELISLYKRDLLGICFSSIEEFYYFDTKLSYQEIMDSVELVNRFNPNDPPLCDECNGRGGHWCAEVMRTSGISTDCHYQKTAKDVEFDNHLSGTDIARYVEEDTILEKQRVLAKKVGRQSGLLVTLNDVILFWENIKLDSSKCIYIVKQTRDFSFDPFWNIGRLVLPIKGQ
jgi:hypothetical protein